MAELKNKRYDHPHYLITRQQSIFSETSSVSGVALCHFRTRAKSVVKHVTVRCISAPSVASGQIAILRNNATTLKTHTVSTASLVASAMFNYTLVSSNTLATLTDYINIAFSGTDKGKWEVIYEYQMLPGGTL